MGKKKKKPSFESLWLWKRDKLHFLMTTAKREPPSSRWLHLEDLDLKYNSGLDYNERLMLEDLIKNGSIIGSCKFNDEGHIEYMFMKIGEKLSQNIYFPRLFELQISYDTPLDVKFIKTHNKSINWLTLRGKNLSKIPDLSELINLKHLDLCHNNIDSINGCGNLPELRTLRITNNQIKSLKGFEEFKGCQKLIQIDLSNNQIIELCEFEPISHLCSLESINLSKNRITEVNITHDVPRLRELSLFDNKINKIIAIKNLSGLNTINLWNNKLTRLENMSNLPKLHHIYIDDNPMHSFNGIDSIPELQQISGLKKESFESYQEIEELRQYFKNLKFKFYWTDSGLVINKIKFPTLTYRVNKYLSLKLKRDKADGSHSLIGIHVDGEYFRQCACLLFTIEIDKIRGLESVNSIDELEERADPNKHDRYLGRIPAEEEFWGHCSNIQAWVEHNYDTRILHRNLAFPLLKKLTEAGDLTAKKVFKEEIAKRFSSGHPSVQEYLKIEGYLEFLSEEELTSMYECRTT